jgi:hypothetical protein
MTRINIDEIPVSQRQQGLNGHSLGNPTRRIPRSKPSFFWNILYPSKTIQNLRIVNCLITKASFC